MTSRRRRILALALAAATAAILLAAALVWRAAGALIAPAHATVGPPPAAWNTRQVSIASTDGITLAGWYVTAPAADARAGVRSVALLLHPIRGSRRSMVPVADSFLAHGFDVLAVDLRVRRSRVGEGSSSKAGFSAAPRELIVFEGAAHVDLLRFDRARWEAAVFGFARKHGFETGG